MSEHNRRRTKTPCDGIYRSSRMLYYHSLAHKNAVLSKQAGSRGTHFQKIKSLLLLTLVGKRIQWEIDWTPPIKQQLIKDFTTTCKQAKSLLPSVNCTKCACAKKEIPCIEQCSCRRKCSLLQGQLHYKLELIYET